MNNWVIQTHLFVRKIAHYSHPTMFIGILCWMQEMKQRLHFCTEM